jgi:hypothetical protein
MWGKIEERFVGFWRIWYKLWSVRLAGAVGTLAAMVLGNKDLALSLINYLPEGAPRIIIAVILGCVIFIIPTLTVLLKQDKLSA